MLAVYMAVPRPGGWRLCAAFVYIYDIRHGMPIGSIIMTPQTVQDMGHGQNVFLWVGPYSHLHSGHVLSLM